METNKKDVLQDLSNIVSWLKEKAKNFSIKSVASKTLSWVGSIMTWKSTPKITWFFNKLIYFLITFGILNIIYFSVMDIIEPFSYAFISFVVPLIIVSFVNKGGMMGNFFQKLFFNETELAIITWVTLITFFYLKFMS